MKNINEETRQVGGGPRGEIDVIFQEQQENNHKHKHTLE